MVAPQSARNGNMDHFRIRPLGEPDIDAVVTAAGGSRAHDNAYRRMSVSADYLLENTLIELKGLDDDGLAQPERQIKLATLFKACQPERPVIVLDKKTLPLRSQAAYDRILEGPIKNAVSKARKQLKQSRKEMNDADSSVLLIINNGYTAIDHDALCSLVARRVRNDTTSIDGIIVAGCYYYSDGFDSYFIWPMEFIPINVNRPFPAFQRLRRAWNDHAEMFMTSVVRGEPDGKLLKGPVIDAEFDVEGVRYVKPVPPIGRQSTFYGARRPRRDTSGLDGCPPVAITYPAMSRDEWTLFRRALPNETELEDRYDAWLVRCSQAASLGCSLQPFVRVNVTCVGWSIWCSESGMMQSMNSVRNYANGMFDTEVHRLIAKVRERRPESLLPSRYVLAVTEEIGQDRANDVSHIMLVWERPNADAMIRPVVRNARIFHEHAIAIAAAHAYAESLEAVLWSKDLTYAWT